MITDDICSKPARARFAGYRLGRPAPAAAARSTCRRGLPAGTREEAALEALPGKKPLIKLTYRPPNYETPDRDFPHRDHAQRRVLRALSPRRHSRRSTPDLVAHRRRRGGRAAGRAHPRRAADEIPSRSRSPRSASAPAIGAGCSSRMWPGVEWGYGAMGNARWRGVRLKDVLAKAGVKQEAIESCSTAPTGRCSTRRRISSRASRCGRRSTRTTIIAYEMNGAAAAAFQRLPGAARSCPAGPRPIG